MRGDINLPDLETAFVANASGALAAFGRDDMKVLHNFAYLKQGRQSGSCLYYHIGSPIKLGNADRKYENGKQHEKQHYQAEILVKVVSDEDALEDAILVANILNSLSFIEGSRAAGFGVQHVSDIQALPVKNENDNFEIECNIRMLITFNRTIEKVQPAISGYSIKTNDI